MSCSFRFLVLVVVKDVNFDLHHTFTYCLLLPYKARFLYLKLCSSENISNLPQY